MGDCWGSSALVSLLVLVAYAKGDRLVSDGNQLADAVASLPTGADNTLFLGSEYITMRNVTFASAPFEGLLTIQPGPNVSQPVLDAAMRTGLTKPGSSGPGRIQLQGFTLVNLCEFSYPVPLKSKVPATSPWVMALFSFSRAVQRLAYSDIILYGRHASITVLLYQHSAANLNPHFSRVRNLTAWLVVSVPESEDTHPRATRYSVTTAGSFSLPAVLGSNVTLKSTANPYDPVLNAMRAAGTLMPPTLCNGTLLPAEVAQAEVDFTYGPLWLASSGSEMADALTQAAALSWVQTEQDLPPAVYVCEGLMLDTLVGPLAISRILWLTGPKYMEPVLDLAQGADVLVLAPGAQLYVQDLTLAGLATSPLSVSAAAAVSQVPSAFPLRFVSTAAGPDTWASSPYLWLYNVTLMLPTNDYLALMSLVLGDSHSSMRSRILQDSTISALAGQLRSGISQLTAGAVAPSLQSFSLALLTGWGINATSLTLKPATPLGADTLAESSSESDSSTNDTQLILACVLGTAIPLLLLLAGVMGWMVWRERRLHGSAAVSGKSSMHMEGAQGGGDGGGEGGSTGGKEGVFVASAASARSDTASYGHQVHAAGTSNSFRTLHVGHAGQQVVSTAGRTATLEWSEQESGISSGAVALCYAQQGVAPVTTVQADGAVAVASSLLLTVQCAGLMHASQLGMAGTPRGVAPYASRASLAGMQCRPVDGQPMPAQARAPVLAVPRLAIALASQPSLPTNQQLGSDCGDGPDDSWSGATRADSEQMTGGLSKVVVVLDMPPAAAAADMSTDRPTDQRQLVQRMAAQLSQGGDADKVVIKKVLGKGASGTVYAGVWRGLPVALKTMVFSTKTEEGAAAPSQGQQGQGQQQGHHPPDSTHSNPRAIMEVAIAASLGHPNVVATYCYDCKAMGTHQDNAAPGELQIAEDFLHDSPVTGTEFKMYLVQELCGQSLEIALAAFALRQAGTSLTDQRGVCLMLLDIAQGLKYLHDNGIIHGDLKPANVLLKVEPKSPTGIVAKLADFGFSTHMGPTATHVSNYSSGTPFYAAPEVVHERRASTASDVFSYGVICWQLWTGCTPYVSTGDGSRFDPRFPGFFEPNVPPPAFKDLTLQCLRQDPRERPTATMIIGALHKCLAAGTK